MLAVFVWNFYCCFFCPVLVVTWCACSFCLEFLLLFLLSCFSSDMVCLQSFCLEFLLLFLLSCFSSDMVCLQFLFGIFIVVSSVLF